MKLFFALFMKLTRISMVVFVLSIGVNTLANAQNWQPQSKAIAEKKIQSSGFIEPARFNPVSLDMNEMKQVLSRVSKNANDRILALPLPYGGFERFRIEETPMMEEALAIKYPEIKTYTARSIDNENHFAKIDIGYMGFHAMVFSSEGNYFIDPVEQESFTNYISYYRKDIPLSTNTLNCLTLADDQFLKETDARLRMHSTANAVTFRNYRLALACTGEYSKAATGLTNPTKEQVLSKMVTTMNRVNGVYETEVAVTMTLVANNDTLIFLNQSTDPYTNNDGFSMLDQNQDAVDDLIGTANYDIGHVFSTGGGGVAGLGVVCSGSRKAEGVTGRPNPVGDPFDIDYVAHEMGHQFGANHTFNSVASSCGGGNRNSSTAYEPGSGTTIMAYAGICGADDIAANSNPYFHTKSLDEINAFIAGWGNSCAAKTPNANNSPIVEAGEDYTIPKSTPFILQGSAIDPDGHSMTYSWEQFDLGPAGSPNNPTGNAPLFRFYPPVSEPVRIFPKLSDVLNNTQTKGERLPSYARTMKFRLIARDNQQAGGTGNDLMTITVDDNSGPFEITFGNVLDTLIASVPRTITWNVNNTNQAPVNCTHVNILLSSDGGQTFPHVLVANTPNDGSEQVSFPPLNIPNARIKVEAVGNIFFDINNKNLVLQNSSAPDFIISQSVIDNEVCPGDTVSYYVTVDGVLGFNDTVHVQASSLPQGAEAWFASNTLMPGDTTILKIVTHALVSTTYNFVINASSNGIYHGIAASFKVVNTVNNAATLTAPANNAVNVNTQTNFKWNIMSAATGYHLQMATTDDFSDLFIDTLLTGGAGTSFFALNLEESTEYFWRVSGLSTCAEGPFSPARRFISSGIPAVPVLSLSTMLPNGVTLEWTDALNEAYYILERSENDTLNFVILKNLSYDITSYEDTGLTVDVNYFYRVKSVNAIGSSNYSNLIQAMLVSGINSERNAALSVYPNPVQNELNFVLSETNEMGAIQISISDQLGRRVRMQDGIKDQAIYQTRIDLSDLMPGVYVVRVLMNNQQYHKIIVK